MEWLLFLIALDGAGLIVLGIAIWTAQEDEGEHHDRNSQAMASPCVILDFHSRRGGHPTGMRHRRTGCVLGS